MIMMMMMIYDKIYFSFIFYLFIFAYIHLLINCIVNCCLWRVRVWCICNFSIKRSKWGKWSDNSYKSSLRVVRPSALFLNRLSSVYVASCTGWRWRQCLYSPPPFWRYTTLQQCNVVRFSKLANCRARKYIVHSSRNSRRQRYCGKIFAFKRTLKYTSNMAVWY